MDFLRNLAGAATILTVTAVSSMAMPATSLASVLMDKGDYTLDTSTGLEWQDLTQTAGMSYDAVENTVVTPDGWHIATLSDVLGLAKDAGLPMVHISDSYYDAQLGRGVSAALSQLGDLLGWVRDTESTAVFDWGDGGRGVLDMEITSLFSSMTILNDPWPTDYTDPNVGVLLVRDADVAVTPLPGGAYLFISGLGLIGFVSWRKRRGELPFVDRAVIAPL